MKPHLTTEHTVVLRVSQPGQTSVDVVSSYFQYRKETERFVKELTEIDKHLDKRVVMGIDVNALSPWWHHPRRNNKSRLVEKMIMELKLTIENCPDNGWSFHGPRGNSNVDVTLTRN